jgi:hypothetical protein
MTPNDTLGPQWTSTRKNTRSAAGPFDLGQAIYGPGLHAQNRGGNSSAVLRFDRSRAEMPQLQGSGK